MTSKELIKYLLSQSELTNADLAKQLGISQAALWDRLNPKKTNNMTVSKMNEMLEPLGYALMVVPITEPENPDNGYYHVE